MKIKEVDRTGARLSTTLTALLLVGAATIDGLHRLRGTGAPRVSYVLLAVAIAAGCLGVLLRTLSRWQGRRSETSGGLEVRPRGPATGCLGNVVELAVLGLLLLGWWLRGEAGIPADPPVIAVEAVGAFVFAVSAAWRRRPTSVNDPRVR